jgi:hypothetical protein
MLTLPLVGHAEAPGMQAHAAERLVDSIGVNIHAWPGYSYVSGRNWQTIILPALRDLGVRHLRDGLGTDLKLVGRHAELVESGFRLTLITNPQTSPGLQLGTTLSRIGLKGVAMLEGVNEPDGSWGQSPGQNAEMAVFHQRELYAYARPRNIPVAASALIDAGQAPKFQGQAQYADYGNCHPYPGGRLPETGGWGDHGYGSIQYARDRLALAVAGDGKPYVATEAGYNNAVSARAKAAGGNHGCSEAVAAAYEPRLFLHYLNTGVWRTFHYELFNQAANPDDAEANFGWVRHDGSRKPAFLAMQRLISILSDPGPSFQPGRLALSLGGETDQVMSCLLQKRDRSWYLALWVAQSLWDVRTFSERAVRPRSITLHLPVPPAEATVARLDDRMGFSELAPDGQTLRLTVGSHVSIVRLVLR